MANYVALTMRCASKGDHFRAIFRWSESRMEYVFFEAVPLAPLSAGQENAAGPSKAGGASAKPHESSCEFDLFAFNFHGFVCPACGTGRKYAPFTRAVYYVKCGRCGELVCGVRVDDVEGTLMFRCHDRCEGGGEVTTGPVIAAGISGDARPRARALALEHGRVEEPSSLSLSAPSSKELTH